MWFVLVLVICLGFNYRGSLNDMNLNSTPCPKGGIVSFLKYSLRG